MTRPCRWIGKACWKWNGREKVFKLGSAIQSSDSEKRYPLDWVAASELILGWASCDNRSVSWNPVVQTFGQDTCCKAKIKVYELLLRACPYCSRKPGTRGYRYFMFVADLPVAVGSSSSFRAGGLPPRKRRYRGIPCAGAIFEEWLCMRDGAQQIDFLA